MQLKFNHIKNGWPNFSSYTGLKDFRVVENKWKPVILKFQDKRRQDHLKGGKVSFVLSMFPYPSGKLHMGHLRVYTVSDVLCRYKCMNRENAFQAMGWDAFGLPAENAAIDNRIPPSLWTQRNITSMKKQLMATMLLDIDWSREISTCDPCYYKWTQWLFIKLYQRGLAYQRLAYVNWDPVDKTVLADELVDCEGRSWRSGALVEKRPLRQWYFKTTVYAKSLLEGLKEIENNQWRDVIKMQRGWIGDLNGTQMEFDLFFRSDGESQDQGVHWKNINERLVVFTTYPNLAVSDMISHIEIGPDSVYFADSYRMPESKRGMNFTRKLLLHTFNSSFDTNCIKMGIMSASFVSPWPESLALSAQHPFTGRLIPVLRVYKSIDKLVRAFPAEIVFSLDHKLPAFLQDSLELSVPPAGIQTNGYILPDIDKLNELSHSELENYVISSPVVELHGKTLADSMNSALQLLRITGRGGHLCNEYRSDWLVSRQRYWGTPIPIIHCNSCGAVPVPENDLPVLLPQLEHAFERGDLPLKDNLKWRTTQCPNCGKTANRETDTLDTFVDSSWYYLRYLDPMNHEQICASDKASEMLPIDIYVGGIEHAIRHLYYSRFIAHFLFELGVIPRREPFKQFLPVGLLLAQTYIEPKTGRFVPADRVEECVVEGKVELREKETGTLLHSMWDKMSKSKMNGIDPVEIAQQFGLDTIRLVMLANVGPHSTRKWGARKDDHVINGVLNWTHKLSRLVDQLVELSIDCGKQSVDWSLPYDQTDDLMWNYFPEFIKVHESIVHRVNNYYVNTFIISAVIARLQELTEILRKTSVTAGGPGPRSFIYLRALADLLVMLAPVAPIYACELWSGYQLACLTNASTNVTEVFSAKRDAQSMGTFDYWPYNLEQLILEQPFPTLAKSADTHNYENVVLVKPM